MTSDHREILDLARDHGLELDPESFRIIEMGLDFRVVLGDAADPQSQVSRWVLRIPRRPAVMEQARVEGKVLTLVAPQLGVDVPDWRIHSDTLIAYPLLPGEPGLELNETGEPVWAVDPSSEAYSLSLAELLAQLHQIDPATAAATGISVHTPEQARQQWQDQITRVGEEFTIAKHLLERWQAWLSEDSYWPDHCVLTHGEIYPGHTLIREGRISGVLDWTTASVTDPAKDLLFHQATASPEAFALTLRRYEELGGRTWPRLVEHCAEMFAANALGYAIYALETGAEEHREAARAGLNPPAVS
ncbi:Phosphotransferase enzyme family protein [Corynebacterium occultum]|uniref:Phosphotransferase enzyme family protein n=1 Tax=Corynebacterium occultum TaxID=2675219 RepID=A0A6B8W0S4_9CORY|nr:macrolide 2'-phosphotransferase [Corynebacterium occultum]QGU06081.1 Phosphotransferase enzyme family protein [Corynebacterium occultum]